MRQTTRTRKSHGEKIVKDIKRATRKHYSSEEKIREGFGLQGGNAVRFPIDRGHEQIPRHPVAQVYVDLPVVASYQGGVVYNWGKAGHRCFVRYLVSD